MGHRTPTRLSGMTSEGRDPAVPATDARSTRRPRVPTPDHESGVRPLPADLHLCPFLVTASGSWRAAFPVREHECGAVAPSVPLALDTGIRDGRVQRGQLLLLEAFGGGFTWGSALVRY